VVEEEAPPRAICTRAARPLDSSRAVTSTRALASYEMVTSTCESAGRFGGNWSTVQLPIANGGSPGWVPPSTTVSVTRFWFGATVPKILVAAAGRGVLGSIRAYGTRWLVATSRTRIPSERAVTLRCFIFASFAAASLSRIAIASLFWSSSIPA
jgi:hypothetical protein